MDEGIGNLWRGLAGRQGGKPPADEREALDAMRDAGMSTREIAERLGVTPRTVQRWTTTRGSERRRAPRRVVDEAAADSRVRSKAIPKRRRSRIRNQGATLRISGRQGPPGSPSKYRRTVKIYLDGDTMDSVLEAWENGNDEAAAEIMSEALDADGYRAWTWEPDCEVDFLR
ncbi:MAG: helix-turn-helix domain-containing protein [Thermoanaerobaculia bacterium]